MNNNELQYIEYELNKQGKDQEDIEKELIKIVKDLWSEDYLFQCRSWTEIKHIFITKSFKFIHPRAVSEIYKHCAKIMLLSPECREHLEKIFTDEQIQRGTHKVRSPRKIHNSEVRTNLGIRRSKKMKQTS